MPDHPTEQVDSRRRPISVLIHDPEPDPFDPITADEIREVLQDVGYPVQSVILQQGFPAPAGLDIPRPHPTEQVDRVAEAIWSKDPESYDFERWNWLSEEIRNNYRAMACAALDAATERDQ